MTIAVSATIATFATSAKVEVRGAFVVCEAFEVCAALVAVDAAKTAGPAAASDRRGRGGIVLCMRGYRDGPPRDEPRSRGAGEVNTASAASVSSGIPMTRDLTLAIGSAVFAAVIMTIGDFVWASQLLRHRMAYGLLHGAGLCLALGLALGAPAKRPLTGALGGLAVGLLSAASFYVLAPLMRYSAMLASWVVLWILLALLDRMLHRGSSIASALMRGALAAVGSGAAFWAVSGMWDNWNPQTINYADHFVRWAIAFLPGFLALHLFSGRTTR
jgi:hypothetical protein